MISVDRELLKRCIFVVGSTVSRTRDEFRPQYNYLNLCTQPPDGLVLAGTTGWTMVVARIPAEGVAADSSIDTYIKPIPLKKALGSLNDTDIKLSFDPDILTIHSGGDPVTLKTADCRTPIDWQAVLADRYDINQPGKGARLGASIKALAKKIKIPKDNPYKGGDTLVKIDPQPGRIIVTQSGTRTEIPIESEDSVPIRSVCVYPGQLNPFSKRVGSLGKDWECGMQVLGEPGHDPTLFMHFENTKIKGNRIALVAMSPGTLESREFCRVG